MFKKYQGKLYCFSPPVMLATFLIEFGLAFYTLWRYKMTAVSRLAIVTLFALGTFQLSEYMVCGGMGLSNTGWTRVGYGAITLLPALGVHMLLTVADKRMPALINAAYTSCAIFFGFYLLTSNSVSLQACYANYAVFSVYRPISLMFSAYYYGWTLTVMCLAWTWGNKLPKQKQALHAMVFGCLVFLIPTATVNIIDPTTTRGLPSIMCGFAVLYAIILVAKILPNSCEVRTSIQNWRETLRPRI